MIFASAMTAISGMVNSAMTRMEATVRNLLYIGILSMKKFVRPEKLCPQDSKMLNTVAAKRHHFIGPFRTKRLRKNSMSTKAPT